MKKLKGGKDKEKEEKNSVKLAKNYEYFLRNQSRQQSTSDRRSNRHRTSDAASRTEKRTPFAQMNGHSHDEDRMAVNGNGSDAPKSISSRVKQFQKPSAGGQESPPMPATPGLSQGKRITMDLLYKKSPQKPAEDDEDDDEDADEDKNDHEPEEAPVDEAKSKPQPPGLNRGAVASTAERFGSQAPVQPLAQAPKTVTGAPAGKKLLNFFQIFHQKDQRNKILCLNIF